MCARVVKGGAIYVILYPFQQGPFLFVVYLNEESNDNCETCNAVSPGDCFKLAVGKLVYNRFVYRVSYDRPSMTRSITGYKRVRHNKEGAYCVHIVSMALNLATFTAILSSSA